MAQTEFLCPEQIEQIQRLCALVAGSHYRGGTVTLVIENNFLRRVGINIEEKAALPQRQIERVEQYKNK